MNYSDRHEKTTRNNTDSSLLEHSSFTSPISSLFIILPPDPMLLPSFIHLCLSLSTPDHGSFRHKSAGSGWTPDDRRCFHRNITGRNCFVFLVSQGEEETSIQWLDWDTPTQRTQYCSLWFSSARHLQEEIIELMMICTVISVYMLINERRGRASLSWWRGGWRE